MEVVADLHLHSKYSRAVSQNMTLPIMAQFAKQKGINLLTTGDFTHPVWIREIKAQLEESENGIYKVKGDTKGAKYILSVEVSSIYSQGGKGRRIHSLIFAPSIEIAEKINQELIKRGCNLSSDGRPIVGLSPSNLIELIMAIDERCFLIPCHVWTPWFSLYGSMSGFDSIEECFGQYSKYVYGIETGLSSDPGMNWRIKELASRSILSFSDSHSPMKMGREATVFNLKELSFNNIKSAIMRKGGGNRIAYTTEFYPEEGKYHYSGHRNCKIVYSPRDVKEKGTICPVCKKGLTIGVMERVEDLAGGEESTKTIMGKSGVAWITDPMAKHPPYARLVPLNEVIAECIDSTPTSLKVKDIFDLLTNEFESEFNVLLKTSTDDIKKIAGEKIAMGILLARNGHISISPGYDGEYGIVKIETEKKEQVLVTSQESLEF